MFLSCIAFPTNVKAQTIPAITITTDKSSYSLGDTIIISGQVQAVTPNTLLTIQILDPNNNLIQIAQIDVAPNGQFTKSFSVSGSLWITTGTYVVKAQYGLPNVTAQSTFQFVGNSQTSNQASFQYEGPVQGSDAFVSYNILGGLIRSMRVDTQTNSLMISLYSQSDGQLTIMMPRTLIDSVATSGGDTPFSVFIDGAQIVPQGATSDVNSRTLTIPFLQGDKSIQIMGTQVLPEFGSMVPLVLVISIITVIIISTKSNFNKI